MELIEYTLLLSMFIVLFLLSLLKMKLISVISFFFVVQNVGSNTNDLTHLVGTTAIVEK